MKNSQGTARRLAAAVVVLAVGLGLRAPCVCGDVAPAPSRHCAADESREGFRAVESPCCCEQVTAESQPAMLAQEGRSVTANANAARLAVPRLHLLATSASVRVPPSLTLANPPPTRLVALRI